MTPRLTILIVILFIVSIAVTSNGEGNSEAKGADATNPVKKEKQGNNPRGEGLGEVSKPPNEGGQAKPKKGEYKRLPKLAIPSTYRITLEPDLEKLTFKGTETIRITFSQQTNKVVLNGKDLKVTSAGFKLESADDRDWIKSQNIQVADGDEQIILTFPQHFKAGKSGDLKLSFSGVLNDKMKGFYRAKYPQANGTVKYAATTQFEPTNARMAFPCWDEPAIKATFEIKLVAPADKVCLSNMPVMSEVMREDGKKEVSFDGTPIMSTYLVAFVVGDYEAVSAKTKAGKTIRVFTAPGQKDKGTFALQTATRALDFYTEYFKIGYPLPKLDNIAISDFNSGAMENWGLVTYRESELLLDQRNSTSQTEQIVALIVSHELAHQWFGNLVTMEWFEDLWLNEGFAKFMEKFTTDKLYPEYHIWQTFMTDDTTVALSKDALHSSHPIMAKVNDPAEVDAIFDDVTYAKGASVIRMMHDWMTDDKFRSGMYIYLNRFKYKNAVTEDLYKALEEASDKPIGRMMRTWTKQTGYPLVTVSQNITNNKRTIFVRQEKFVADGHLSKSEQATNWLIPLTFTTSTSPNRVVSSPLLSTKSDEFTMDDIAPDEWVKINHDFVGFYRVQYSEDMLKALKPAIKSKKLPPLDRLTIQSDLCALAQSGKSDMVEVLRLLNSYKDEDEYAVWVSISSCVNKINSLLAYSDKNGEMEKAFQKWQKKFYGLIYRKVGWDVKTDEKHTDTLLRGLILSKMASLNEPSAEKKSQQLWEDQMSKKKDIPADLRTTVYTTMGSKNDPRITQQFKKMYKEATMPDEKQKLAGALSKVSQPNQIKEMIEYAMDEEFVRTQDAPAFLSGLASSKTGRDLVWSWIKSNPKKFQEKFSGSANTLSRLLGGFLGNFASNDKANEISKFFKDHKFEGIDNAVNQSVEKVRINAAWLSRDKDKIKKYLMVGTGGVGGQSADHGTVEHFVTHG